MNKKILNVGCGNDTYGTHFIDMNPRRKDVLKVVIGEEKIPFNDNYFDVVYTTWCFEHLTNPNFGLKEMYRVLKPNGRIILVTDNGSGWLWHTPFTKVNYSLHWGKDRHFALYTMHHLKNHFKKAGFRNINAKYIMKDEKVPIKYARIISKILYKIPLFKRHALPHIYITAKK